MSITIGNISAGNGGIAAGVISGSITINNSPDYSESTVDIAIANTGNYPDNANIYSVTENSTIVVNNANIKRVFNCVIVGNNNTIKTGKNVTLIGSGNSIINEVK